MNEALPNNQGEIDAREKAEAWRRDEIVASFAEPESNLVAWDDVKKNQWGESVRTEKSEGGYSSQYVSAQDFLIDNFLNLTKGEFFDLTELSYREDYSAFVIEDRKVDSMLDVAAAVERGQVGGDFRIDPQQITIEHDTRSERNVELCELALERLDNVTEYRMEGDYRNRLYDDEVAAESEAYTKMQEKIARAISGAFEKASNDTIDGKYGTKQKHIAGVIDEQIISNLNTLQYIMSNESKSQEQKENKVKDVMERVAIMRKAQGYILNLPGYGNMIRNDDSLAQ